MLILRVQFLMVRRGRKKPATQFYGR